MTNYAAFYVGRGENAEWIGTVRGDGIPGGLAAAEAEHQPLDATTEDAYRAAVAAFLRVWERWVDHAYVPDESDPNDYSELADLAYTFDNGRVWTRRTHTDPWEPAYTLDPELTFCTECETYRDRSEDHTCIRYDGPPCRQCARPTVDAHVAAPGYGRVRVCKAGHAEELSPCGVLDHEDVR